MTGAEIVARRRKATDLIATSKQDNIALILEERKRWSKHRERQALLLLISWIY